MHSTSYEQPRNTLENLLMEDSDSSKSRKRKKKTTVVLVSIALILLLAVLSVVTYYALLHLNCFWCRSSQDPKTSTTIPETTTPIAPLPSCANISDAEKFDCHPDTPVIKEQCEARKCCYHRKGNAVASDPSDLIPVEVPTCYFPPDYMGYSVVKSQKTETGYSATLRRNVSSGFPNDVDSLKLSIDGIDENTVRITIRDANKERYEVPLNKPIKVKTGDFKKKYDVHLSGTILSVSRKSSGIAVFYTNLNQLVYSDQFLQLSTRLQTEYIYGVGEQYGKFMKNVSWTRAVLFNRDNFPLPNKNLYGTHPIHIGLEADHNSHGVFLLNSHAIEVILQPTPAITYRPIGGILDFFVFLGPKPDEVVQQYTGLLGYPFMPPYWSLGFHLCRYGYNSLNETRKVWKRNRNAELPFDTQWNDIDYMDKRNDFDYDRTNFEGLKDFVQELHNENMHYVIILDPGVSTSEEHGKYPPFDDGIKKDIFIKKADGDLYIGQVWNYKGTAFPDFTHPKAAEYWEEQFQEFHSSIPFDGAWIDMNEPSNYPENKNRSLPECPSNSTLENPPYLPGGNEPLRTHTVCMSALHYNSTPHYTMHNMYGYYEAKLTSLALKTITNKRPFIISRSTFAGQGIWGGHWSGDINSSWEDMRYSVIDLLNFNIFGIPMMGSDICGFRNDAADELCARWSSLGAFYPFSRNHNDINNKDQDPAAMGGNVLKAAKNSLTTRYRLLPYLYYLFYESHVYGKTVTRPLFFEFTDDSTTYGIDEQFMWGSALMIMPVMYEKKMEIEVYFPKAVWYDYYTGEQIEGSGTRVTLKSPIDSINLAFRGGYIIPHQHNNLTTIESRLNEFYLLAGLDAKQTAKGELYWDDGESLGSYEQEKYNLIKFSIENNSLESVIIKNGYDTDMVLDYVKICGIDNTTISDAKLNDKSVPFTIRNKCLKITVHTSLKEKFIMTWK